MVDRIVNMRGRGMRGPLGFKLNGSPTPGQFLVKSAGSDPREFNTASGTGGGDTALRTDLAAPEGAAMVGVKYTSADANPISAQQMMRNARINVANGFVTMGEANSTAGIAKAIAALQALGGGVLEIPRGVLRVDTIEITSTNGSVNGGSIIIRGEGPGATRIMKPTSGATAAPLIDITGADNPTEGYFEISDLSVNGSGATHHGVELNKVAKFTLRNVQINNCNHALHLNGALVGDIFGCRLQGSVIGLYTVNESSTLYPNAINLYGGNISGCSQWGIDSTSSGLHVYGGDIEFCGNGGGGGVRFRSTSSAEIGSGFCSINGTWLENNSNVGILAEAGMSDTFSLALRDIQVLNVTNAIDIKSGIILIENVRVPSPDTQINIAAAACTMINVFSAIINDSTPYNARIYINVGTSASGVSNNGGFGQGVPITSDSNLAFYAPNGVTEQGLSRNSTTGRLTYYGTAGFQVSTGNYTQPMWMGSYAFWVDDDGNLRKKFGAPTSQSDGSLV